MVLAIIYSSLFVFCILGLSEILFAIKLLFFGKNKQRGILLLYLDANDYYSQLVCAIEKMNWYGNIYDKIIAVTDYVDEGIINDCKKIASVYNNKNVSFLKENDITNKS